MIELKQDRLVFSFPELHPQAQLNIEMQRTLRIPDDGKTYPLPPGLGEFPIRHVDDYASEVPDSWRKRGGVMMPMYQSEALWLNFDSRYIANRGVYPFAIKIATGKINAVTGEDWSEPLGNRPQDYVVSPKQPWLDGYCVSKGKIRQFVAMPLGAGYSAEEQITGEAEFGGIQIKVIPMKRAEFEKRFPENDRAGRFMMDAAFSETISCMVEPEMGLAPGGEMRQEIYDDEFGIDVWDESLSSRCFVHLTNSLVWRSITGQNPPHAPVTAKKYSQYGLPWFDYYSDRTAIQGSSILDKLKSVVQIGKEKGQKPLPENQSADIQNVKVLSGKKFPDQVREGNF
jgi:hypothetical protein